MGNSLKHLNLLICFLIATYFSIDYCYAAAPPSTEQSPFDIVDTILKGSGAHEEEITSELKEYALELVQNDPELVNKIFDFPLVKDSFLGKLFEDTHIKLKVFEPDEEGESASLGFNYVYNKNKKLRFNKEKKVNYSGLDLALNAKGNLAFDNDINPNDFLDSKLSLSYFLSSGGVVEKIVDPETLDRFQALIQELATMEYEALNKSTQWAEFKSITGKNLSDQYYFNIGFDGGLESDQSFNKTQHTYGFKASFVPRGWAEDSIFGTLNIIDYIPLW